MSGYESSDRKASDMAPPPGRPRGLLDERVPLDADTKALAARNLDELEYRAFMVMADLTPAEMLLVAARLSTAQPGIFLALVRAVRGGA